MRRSRLTILAYLIIATPCIVQANEPDAHVTIDVQAAGRPVPKTLYGIFFEDIN